MNQEVKEESIPQREWEISHDLAEDGQVAVFDGQSSELILFNEIGGLIWKEIDGRKSVATIVDALVELPLSKPPKSEILLEAKQFLKDLFERGAISFL